MQTRNTKFFHLVANSRRAKNSIKGRNGFILKLDFHKAFDFVRWEYFDQVMDNMGFDKKWRNIIQDCISSSHLAILINGSPSQEFSVQKGLK